MTKSELITQLTEAYPDLLRSDIIRIVNTFFDKITAALSCGDRVELRGFGAFSVKRRNSRKGRNPRTGESVNVAAKYTPYFKIGKQLHDKLNIN